MQRKRSTIFAALLCLSALTLGGCAIAPQPDPTTQSPADFEAGLREDVHDAVATYIVLGDANNRATRVLTIATRVKEQAETGVGASDLRMLAINLIASQFDEDDRAAATVLTNVIVSRVKRRFGLGDVTVIPADALPQTRHLVIAAAEAAIQAASELHPGGSP